MNPVQQPVTPPTALGEGVLPNLVVVGVTKAGTTSLYGYLGQHPQVCASDEKEVRHYLPLRYGEEIPSLEEYAAHFRGCGDRPVAMEASPGYFFGGATIARAMERDLPGVRTVVSFRDPVQRCWSFYTFMQSRAALDDTVPFGQWLDRAMALVESGEDQLREHHVYSGLGTGMYSRWLPEWQQVFGDRLRVLWFDDLAARPQQVTAELCSWMGIDVAAAEGFDYGVRNSTRTVRHQGVQGVALAVNRRLGSFLNQHEGAKQALRRVYYSVNQSHSGPRLDPSDRRRLEEFYAPHNAALRGLLDPQDLAAAPAWLRG